MSSGDTAADQNDPQHGRRAFRDQEGGARFGSAVDSGACAPERREAADTVLMEAIQDDDPAALRALMVRYWGALIGYSRRSNLSPDEANDVAQEVFVRVWEHRARWTSGGSPQGYLYRIARTLILEGFRHQDVRVRTRDRVRARAGRVVTPFEEAARHELEAAIEEAIEALPERRREAFVMVRIEGLSLQAAAEALGLSRQTVANHVHLAVRDLQSALGPFLA